MDGKTLRREKQKIAVKGWGEFPVIKTLPDDPEWEAVEKKIAEHCARNLPPFEESEHPPGQTPAT